MKHVRTFEKFRIRKNREEIIKESVLQVNDLYKVKTMIDIPQSLINAYVKKVKDTTGKNLRQFFGDVDVAEEIVKWVTLNFLDVDKIPGGAIMGGQTQAQAQGGQVQPQVQVEGETQAQPQAQIQDQGQAQPQAQVDMDGFEEPIQGQAQGQPQAQTQGQAQGQPQVQVEGQPQAQTQVQAQEDEDEEENELPL